VKVFVTGGSGLIGRHLCRRLAEAGHEPWILSRHSDAVRRKPEFRDFRVIQGDPAKEGRWQEEIDGCDAVVNLAGHNLFAQRWNAEIKRKIRDSRVYGTEHVVAAIRQARNRPQVLVQASAIGFYGPHEDEELDESSPSGTDFLAVTCREWEDASAPVEELGVRRAVVRIGIVLAPGEGALAFMTPIFKLGPGAPVGSGGKLAPATGKQWMSWIHIHDIVGIFHLAIEHPDAAGPINGTAPNPVRNAEFSKTLSKVLWRPYAPWRFFIPLGPPDAALRLLLGEVAGVVTAGQKVLPRRALALGYQFQYPTIEEALRNVFTPPPPPKDPSESATATTASHSPKASCHHH
jgi:uncharacterized protein (TIGR01777 family)